MSGLDDLIRKAAQDPRVRDEISKAVSEGDDTHHLIETRSVDFRPDPSGSFQKSDPRGAKRQRPTKTRSATSLGGEAEQATAGPSSSSERLLGAAIQGEYSYAKLGLILGLSSILGGVILGIHGAVGAVSWTAQLLGLQSQLNDAGPGVVLFIVGLFMIVATRPRVRLGDLRG